MRRLSWGLAVMSFLLGGAGAGRCENGVTNILSGVVSNAGGTIVVGSTGTNNYMEINGGSTLISYDAYVGQNSTALGNSVLVTGSGTLWTNTHDLFVGWAGKSSEMVISNNATVITLNINAGFLSGGSGTIRIVGATNITTHDINVGEYTLGKLSISGGGYVSSGYTPGDGYLNIAPFAGSTGLVEVLDGTLIVPNATVIGWGGTGALVVAQGKYQTQNAWLGNTGVGSMLFLGGTNIISSDFGIAYGSSGSRGSVLLGGGSLTVTNAIASVGLLGSGFLTVTGGTFLAKDIQIAAQAGSQGTMIITQGGIVAAASLGVGYSSTGTLSVSGGNLYVTNGAGSGTFTVGVSNLGTANLSGGRVQTDKLVVGDASSSNKLSIVSGANLISRNAYIGNSSTALGNSVLVTDSGSLWSNTVSLWVGYAGQGSQMVISNNASMVTWDMNVGWFSGGSGALKVIGATNISTHDITVGWNNGAGSLSISGGGYVSSGYTPGDGALNIAAMAGSSGSVEVLDGKLIIPNDTGIGLGGTGSLMVVQGTYQSSNVWLGDTGKGSLTVLGGTNTISGQLAIGFGVGTLREGMVLVGGGILTATNALTTVGRQGYGFLTVTGGTFLAKDIQVASQAGSQGTMIITQGGIVAAAALEVGYGSAGSLSVSGGNLLVTNAAGNSTLVIGASRRGTASLNGGAIQANKLVIGDTSTSNYLGISGGSLISGSAYIGSNATALGNAVVVNGGGSVWSNTGSLYVGYASRQNSLLVSNGAVVTATSMFAGGVGGQGYIQVAGATNIVNDYTIGWDQSQGYLDILSGGFVQANNSMNIATYTGSSGMVQVAGGTLVVKGASIVGNYSTGSLVISSGSFQGQNVVLGHTYQAGLAAGNGAILITGGTNTITSQLTVGEVSGAVGSVLVSGGKLTVTNGAGSALLLAGSGGAGTVTLNGGGIQADRLLVTNGANSVFNFYGGTLFSGGTVVSNGQQFAVGNGTSSASFTLLGGTHRFNNGLFIASNATLSGTGTILGTLTNAGTLAPGNSPGAMAVDGSLVLANGSLLTIEIGGYTPGTQFDTLTVSNGVTLDGLLNLSLVNGFQSTITNGATFTVLTAGATINGAFDNVTSGSWLNTIDGFGAFQVNYLGSQLVLTNFQAIPEPAPAPLLILVALGWAWLGRRTSFRIVPH